MLVIWKKEMEDNNDTPIVSRTPFVVRKKLRRGLKNCLNDMTQILEVADTRIKINLNLMQLFNMLNTL
jgi:hypothetical protein